MQNLGLAQNITGLGNKLAKAKEEREEISSISNISKAEKAIVERHRMVKQNDQRKTETAEKTK